jgi:uncharacterized protein (PEP-CTERM system associated)
VTVTDNVRRAPSDQKKSDGIVEVFPGIAVRAGTPRLRLDFSYIGQKVDYFREDELSRWNNNLAAATTFEAVDNFLFLDASAAITQQFFSAIRPRPQDATGDFSNRFESRAATVSPYMRGRIGESGAYLLRYNRVWSSPGTNSFGLPKSDTDQAIAQIQGPVSTSANWTLDYIGTRTEWENQTLPQEFQRYFGSLYYRPSTEWVFSVLAGREYNNYLLVGNWYTNYGGGVLWRPSERTVAQARVERRFFGTGYLFRLNHRHRQLAFSVDGSRDVVSQLSRLFVLPAGDTRTSLDQALLSFPQYADPVARRAAVDQLSGFFPTVLTDSATFFTQRVFLQKQVSSSVAVLGTRNTLTFTAFWRDIKPVDVANSLLSDDFTLFGNSTQTGGSVNLSHRLTAFSSLNGRLGRLNTRGRGTNPAEATQDDVVVTFLTQLSPKTQAYSGLRVLRFDGSGSTISSDFVEKALFGGFAHTF